MKIYKILSDIPDPLRYEDSMPTSWKNYPRSIEPNLQYDKIIPQMQKGDHEIVCQECQSGVECKLSKAEQHYYDFEYFNKSIPTIKQCPVVIDYLKIGYTLPAWDNLLIQNIKHNGEYKLIAIDSQKKGFTSLNFEQMDTEKLVGKFLNNYAVKFHFPYRVTTEKGYLTVIKNPFYLPNNKIIFSEGIMDTSAWSLMNIFAFLDLQENEALEIKKGTPLLHIFEVHHSIFQSNYEVIDFNNVDWNIIAKYDYNEHLSALKKSHYRKIQKTGLADKPEELK